MKNWVMVDTVIQPQTSAQTDELLIITYLFYSYCCHLVISVSFDDIMLTKVNPQLLVINLLLHRKLTQRGTKVNQEVSL